MFDVAHLQVSTKARTGASQLFCEGVAAFGLVPTILGTHRWRPEAGSSVVGLFITAGYWFTASTLFVNPAITIAHGFTDISRTSSRAMVKAALDGRLAIGATRAGPNFGAPVPESWPGVSAEVLDLRNTWKDKYVYAAAARYLRTLFENTSRNLKITLTTR